MADFTPGPWVIGITVGADGWPTYRIRDMKDPTCMKEKLANANLISASPEMYKALEWLRNLAGGVSKGGDEPSNEEWETAWWTAEQALAKADGIGLNYLKEQ